MRPEQHYWRNLDELAETPEFKKWVEQEFPSGASELADPVSRRRFVKLMSASFLLAGMGITGCRQPEEKIYPFAKAVDNQIHGVPQYFATAMPTRRAAIPVVVKLSEGRPIKVEGNRDCPGSNGGTDHFAQASILSLYDPDRASRFAQNGITRTRQEALDFLSKLSQGLGRGNRTAFLLEQSNSLSLARLQRLAAEKLPEAEWFVHEPVDLSTQDEAASLASGLKVKTRCHFEKAKTFIAFDCDFLGTEENAAANIGLFARGRHFEGQNASMSRLYAVENLFTLTGSNADHRLRVPPSLILPIVAAFAVELVDWERNDARLRPQLEKLAANAKPHEGWIRACARDLKANLGQSVALGGHRLPLEAQLLVLLINEALGAFGIIDFLPYEEPQYGNISELAKSLEAGTVDTLVILGGNPVYNAPVDLNWAQVQAKAKTVIRLGAYEDETAWNGAKVQVRAAQQRSPTGLLEDNSQTQWDLPAAHYLESWGDARTEDGTIVSIQPLIEPLFGGLTTLETLARIAGFSQTSPQEIVRETFRGIGGSDSAWNIFLRGGFLRTSQAIPFPIRINRSRVADLLASASPAPLPSLEKLDLVFYRDSKVDDGRFSNNGWLQELPDPITKLTWDNAILISPKTARDLRLERGVVEITSEGRTIRGPVLIQPGMSDFTLGLALGYGREHAGRIGSKTGFNAYRLRTTRALHYASGATLRKTQEKYELSTTQTHWSMEGRDIVRETTPGAMKGRDHPRSSKESLYPNPLDAAKSGTLHQWGMAIDLNLCVGCSACVTACQSENNVPIVGKEMVGKSREMHWLRIDRYYTGSAEDPQALSQPMFCQHCEAAPCENVCPVNATVHDNEGLNVMVYNRCVGTRYCSNNCPFKVRRFNFFDYNKRPLDELYKSPLTSRTGGEWELKRWFKNRDRGSKPEEEWQLAKLAKNPDVTVRMRGVMEKCTFCQQRIEQAKIAQKIKAGISDKTRLLESEGTIPKTACQQACPAAAIVFGDVSDPTSQVSKIKASDRNYQLLDALNLKPRLSYLAKVRNRNPEMP